MKIYIVGLGPGEESQITGKAAEALKKCDTVAGYGLYIDLIKNLIKDKEIISTPMKREVERCRKAVEAALAGRTVAVVSSGDSGIYGMASLIYEVLETYPGADIDVEVVAGITAASSAAAVLGAPLSNDFAVISLSDYLTPLEIILKRVRLAASGGFVMCIYNPASGARSGYLEKACLTAMEEISGGTLCGYVRNIGRDCQSSGILTLKELSEVGADMLTTVIIGNASTRVINGKLVTPRGYKNIKG